MPVSFTLTEDDWLVALQLHQRELRVWRWTAIGLLLINFVLYILRIIGGHWIILVYLVCPMSIVGAAFAVIVFVVVPGLNRQRIRQMKEALEPMTVDITPDGLHTTNAIGQALRPWSFFTKWKENELLFLLYLNSFQLLLLPKRAFADPAPLAALRGYLNAQSRRTADDQRLPKLFLGVIIAALSVAAIVQLTLLFR